ncbi:unnamed protein product [Discosporangium mesarthrocarpum]
MVYLRKLICFAYMCATHALWVQTPPTLRQWTLPRSRRCGDGVASKPNPSVTSVGEHFLTQVQQSGKAPSTGLMRKMGVGKRAMSMCAIAAGSGMHFGQEKFSGTSAANSPEEGSPQTPPYGVHLHFKGLILNVQGIVYALSVFGWAIAFYPLLLLSWLTSLAFDNGRRRMVDWVVYVWAKVCMLTVTYRPKVIGAENLPHHGSAAMYVPNHCSYMDILTLSGFLPRPLKYISKVEILRIPLIGWAMRMAGHIAIRRRSRRSQLQTFKDAVASLT